MTPKFTSPPMTSLLNYIHKCPKPCSRVSISLNTVRPNWKPFTCIPLKATLCIMLHRLLLDHCGNLQTGLPTLFFPLICSLYANQNNLLKI